MVARVIVISPPSSPPQIRCRQIKATDLGAVADLLTRGFPSRSRKYWTKALDTLAARGAPAGCPEFGYLLEAQGAVVGVLLLIFSEVGGLIRCNVSSWYVEPEHRGHAALLATMASKLKHVTYLNISPAAHTLPILEAQGYRRYSEGQFAGVPALARGGPARVSRLTDSPGHQALPEYGLLRDHAAAGCLALVCETLQGPMPFLFIRRRIAYAPIGVAQLVFARDTKTYAECAGPLGRFLLGQGIAAVICDAEAPVAGHPGLHFKNRAPRYYKGPDQPRPNDLAFTEMALFGA